MLSVLARRMENCATSTTLRLHTPENDATELVFRNNRGCRIGLCMQCARLRAAKTCRIIEGRLVLIGQAHPECRYAFLTLTAKNYPIADVGAMFRSHEQALNRLWRRAEIRHAILGHVTSIEIALRLRSDEWEAGVHSHSLLVLHPDYYSKVSDRYLKQADFVALWRAALQCDYAPICHIKAIADGPALRGALRETVKYAVAPHALFEHGRFGLGADPEVVAHLARALYKRRTVRYGGVFTDAAKVLRARAKAAADAAGGGA